MDRKKIISFVLVYILLIPVIWFLSAAVWGGVHGVLIGTTMGKTLQDKKKSNELNEFMQKHGVSQLTSKEEAKSWFNNLSPEDKTEFQKMVMQSFKIEDVVTFSSAFLVCLIVFGIVGLISGLATKTWLLAGILPAISHLPNSPISRFRCILHISIAQEIILVLLGQFLVCYVFAYIGAKLAIKIAQKKQNKIEVKP
jgi:hypothetical protein